MLKRVAIAGCVLLGGSFPGPATATSAPLVPACGIVPSPNVGTAQNYFYSVASAAPDDTWAVGHYWDDVALSDRTLVEHWDGQAWVVTPSPSPGFDDLSGVAAVSSSDVWAVGSSDSDPLTEHWDGASWTVVDGAHKGIASYLTGAAAVSPNDVWAVGFYKDEGDLQLTLAEHWDGVSWSVASTPNTPYGYNYLVDVAATSANNVWAVGYGVDVNGYYQPLIQHWNGHFWSIVPGGEFVDQYAYLTGVAALSTSDVWAVGYFFNGSGPSKTLTEHWDGTKWSVVQSPNPGRGGNSLGRVAASSGANVWALGSWSGSDGFTHPLIERWDGSRWHRGHSAHLQTEVLRDIGIDPGGTVWAVGDDQVGLDVQTFTAVLC